MSAKQILICFIGTDGSGKSTLSTTISESLKKRNIRVRKTYGRHKYFLSKLAILIGRKFFMKNSDLFLNYDKYLDDKRITYRKYSRLIDLFVFLLMLEYIVQLVFKVTIPLKLGYIVVSDRYIFDTIINEIAVDRNLSWDEVNAIYQSYRIFVPNPDVTFLVQVPEKVAVQRKSDIPSVSYIRIRNELYNRFAQTKEMIILDGTLTISQLETQVMNIMDEKLKIL